MAHLRIWRCVLTGCLGLAVAAACGSGDDDDDDDGAGPGNDVPDVILDPDAGVTYAGGVVPLPEGGLDELRDEACTGWNASPEPQPVVLMLVVDVSNSMNEDPPGSNRSKWALTRDALEQAITELPASAAAGVLYYPNMRTSEYSREVDVQMCVNVDELIPIDLLGPADSEHRADLTDSVDRVTVTGGTPTYEAYVYALEHLRATDFTGNKYLLFITDGQPTYGVGCIGNGTAEDATVAYVTPVVEAITAARADGISTFVIGSPGSERTSEVGEDARPWLSEAAEAGGTAAADCSHSGPDYCHFDMVEEPDFGAGLTRALGEIAGTIVSCNYDLPAPPANQTLDPDAVNVVLTNGAGEQFLVLRDDAADCEEGWHYTDDGQSVALCSDTCTAVKADPEARLELLFGCATQVVPLE